MGRTAVCQNGHDFNMTADGFREIALSMHGAIERAHMGHPDFRANGRIFATLHADDKWGVVMLMPDEQRELLRLHSKMFFPESGAWGRQGCTKVKLAVADEPAVRVAVMLAWQRVVEKPPSRRASKPTRPRAARAPRRRP
jgi:hypothetical protein